MARLLTRAEFAERLERDAKLLKAMNAEQLICEKCGALYVHGDGRYRTQCFCDYESADFSGLRD